jgi:hypothetical protein
VERFFVSAPERGGVKFEMEEATPGKLPANDNTEVKKDGSVPIFVLHVFNLGGCVIRNGRSQMNILF